MIGNHGSEVKHREFACNFEWVGKHKSSEWLPFPHKCYSGVLHNGRHLCWCGATKVK